jgi:hypothetical protein
MPHIEGIPTIDPNVKTMGVSKLRNLNASKLREENRTFVIQENDTPLAVLLSYESFLIMQEKLHSLLNTIEMLSDKEEIDAIRAGLGDHQAGRTRPLAEIRAQLKKHRDGGA